MYGWSSGQTMKKWRVAEKSGAVKQDKREETEMMLFIFRKGLKKRLKAKGSTFYMYVHVPCEVE
jgi:hypothetical protein